jgi:hypothetical protein
VVGGGFDRHRVSALGEDAHREPDALARPAGEDHRIGPHHHPEAAEALGENLSQAGEALRTSVGEERGPDLGERPVEGPAERLDGEHRGIRHQGVKGNRVAGHTELGTGVLVIEKPLGRR